MNELRWYYPDSLDQVPSLLDREDAVPCGGNTLLLRTGLKRVKGLISLTKLGLHSWESNDEFYRVGATMTYGGLVSQLLKYEPDSILVKSLSQAASCPLRNRITLGGSLASFPIWSDLVGPLLALEASVELIGRHSGEFPVSDYVSSVDLRRASLITGLRLKRVPWQSYYYRCGRTVSDHSSFNVSLLWRTVNFPEIADIRIVLVGTRRKYRRLDRLEQYLRGLRIDELRGESLVRDLELPFSSSNVGSADYTAEMARRELARALDRIGQEGHYGE
ncbi:FAD binding domain-containing protein [bacterium]|nr:FAD binding domain-containing protein [bacterium]